MQDISAAWTSQPRVQGDVPLPGGALPALGRHAHGGRVQPTQHEAQGDDRLAGAGPEQQRRGGVAALAGHEGEQQPAGVQMARSPRGVDGRL